jgi:hypothetical protein
VVALSLALMIGAAPGVLADDDDPDVPATPATVDQDDDDAPGARAVAPDDDADDDEGVETENLFGFTEGTDTAEAGERELSNDTVGAFGRRAKKNTSGGRYVSIQNETEFEYGLTDNLTISGSATFAAFDIHRIRGFEDVSTAGFGGLGAELKWRLLDRRTAPFGFAVSAEPEWSRYDEASGERIDGFAVSLKAMADVEIVPDRLFAAANLLYEPEWAKEGDEFERESGLELSAALAGRVADDVFIGGEARFLSAFEGAFFETHQGHALYLGPTLYAGLGAHAYLSGAWSFQVAGGGHQGIGGGINTLDFDRQQAHLTLGIEF